MPNKKKEESLLEYYKKNLNLQLKDEIEICDYYRTIRNYYIHSNYKEIKYTEKLEKLNVFGGDYDTKDGTGVRDFIHVVDLAKGHVAALKKFETPCGLQIYNLGTGQGYSVLEMLHAFEKAVGKKIPYEVVARRPGDIPVCYADPEKAAKELNWHATKNINDMCADTWRWQTMNPNGYDS